MADKVIGVGRQPSGRPSRPTLRTVGALAGVDPSAVSRYLNGDRSVKLSAATRARIDEAVAELGYRPNQAARGLRLSRTWMFGLLIPDLSNPMYQSIARGAWERADATGYALVLGAGPIDQLERTIDRLTEHAQVEGLLVASGSVPDSVAQGLVEAGQPVVVVNRRLAGTPYVILDDAAASRLATEHLVHAGHRDIAVVVSPSNWDTASRRREGFLEAAQGARTAVVENAESWDAAAGYRAVSALLDRDSAITGIVATSTLYGVGVVRAANDRGLRVPQDLSVICMHDSPLLEYSVPRLSTVATPAAELGSIAVDLLASLVEGAEVESVCIDGHLTLVDRGSVAPPR